MNKHIFIIVFIIVATAVLFVINNSSRYEGFKRRGKAKPASTPATDATTPAATPAETPAATTPAETPAAETTPVATPAVTPAASTPAATPVATPAVTPAAPAVTPAAPAVTPAATPTTATATTTTDNKEFVNKALQQQPNTNSLDTELDKLRKSLSLLQTELDAATTAATSSKAVFNEAIKSIDNSKNSAINELNNKMTTLSAVEDQVNKKAKEAEQSKSDAQQIKTDVASMVNTIQLKIDNIATDNLTKDKFTTLEQAYNTNISNLWHKGIQEGFTNLNDGKPWTDADLFTLTNNLSTAIKTFHKTYYEYAACYYKNKTGTKDLCNTSTLATKKTEFDTAVQTLNSATAAATTAIKSLKTDKNTVDDATAKERNAALKTLASQVENTRNDLDQKMKTLEHNNKNYEPEKQLTTAQYVTIGWSVLAASALYYIFTELSE